MKTKIRTLINPLLSIIDNGVFFRKPFGWIYIFLAVLSLAAPFYLIYSSLRLNNAYFDRENARDRYEVFMHKFESLKTNYETSLQNYTRFSNDAQNARYQYQQASQNVTYYQLYSQYYPQEYQNAKQQERQWLSNWKENEKKSKEAQLEYEKLKPEYDKGIVEFNQLSNDYQIAMNNYETKSPQGAFHDSDNRFKSVIGLIVFCLLSVCVGIINYLIFWNRKSKLDLIHKEKDEFLAIPVFAHFIQTIGESIGTYIGIMGFFTVLIALLFKVCFGVFGLKSLFVIDISNLAHNYETGIPYLIIPLISGFLTIMMFRVVSEGIKSLAIIANNTKYLLPETSNEVSVEDLKEEDSASASK